MRVYSLFYGVVFVTQNRYTRVVTKAEKIAGPPVGPKNDPGT